MSYMDAEVLSSTRFALQALAEHVLSAALHEATGHIGLRRHAGGFATPVFTGPGGSTQIRVDGAELAVTDEAGERRAPIETLRAAGVLVGITPAAPASVYTPTTPLDPEAPLAVDGEAAAMLARFFADVDGALEQLRTEAAAEAPADVQLWPEHFDLAITVGSVNYGGSPGDADHPFPYLYVGPHTPPVPDGGFWNEPFGASRPWGPGADEQDVLAFFQEGRRLATGLSS